MLNTGEAWFGKLRVRWSVRGTGKVYLPLGPRLVVGWGFVGPWVHLSLGLGLLDVCIDVSWRRAA